MGKFTEEELANEEWRDIVGWEGLYQVSNLGRVRSLDRIQIDKNGNEHTFHSKMLKLRFDKDGYLVVHLRNLSKSKLCKVHRLVAEAFIDNPLHLPQVNHLSEDKTNNKAPALEWSTCIDNVNYGTGIERRRYNKAVAVNCYDLQHNFIAHYNSAADAKRALCIPMSDSHISACCKNKRHTAYNYIWEYAV